MRPPRPARRLDAAGAGAVAAEPTGEGASLSANDVATDSGMPDAPGQPAASSTDPLPVQGKLSRSTIVAWGAVTAVVANLLAWTTYRPELGISEVWPVSMAMFVTLAGYWNHRGLPRDRGFWLVALGLLVLFVGIGLPFGFGLPVLVWIGVGNLVQALVFGLMYRHRLGSHTWAPKTSGEIGWMVLSAFAAGGAGSILGAYPGTWIMGGQVMPGALWWAMRSGCWIFLGTLVAVWLQFWDRPDAGPSPRRRWSPLLLTLTMLGTSYLQFAYPDRPLTWLAFVPTLWAGMTLSPYGATAYGVASALTAGVLGVALFPQAFGYGSFAAPSLLIDLEVTFIVLLAVQLALFRQERDLATAEVNRQRENAQTQADMLDRMLQGMADGVLLVSPAGIVTWHNDAARALAGHPILGEPVGQWATYFQRRAVVRGDDSSAGGNDTVAALLTPADQVVRAEMRLPQPGGEDRLLAIRSRQLRTLDGERIIILARDITAEHARAQQLEGFAGRVAHDLKGPLTVLGGWMSTAEGALEDGDEEASRMAVSRGHAAVGRLATMIDDWLAYTLTREGVLRPVELRLDDLVLEIAELYDERARPSQPASFVVDVPHRVRADRSLTKVLLANLIGNAVKYCRPGEPAAIRVTSRDAVEPGWVELEVADRGIGIAPGDEDRIFEEYARSERDAGTYQGTGLGLSLCRSIVTRHGGRISARTNADGGATFTLTLPAAQRGAALERPVRRGNVA